MGHRWQFQTEWIDSHFRRANTCQKIMCKYNKNKKRINIRTTSKANLSKLRKKKLLIIQFYEEVPPFYVHWSTHPYSLRILLVRRKFYADIFFPRNVTLGNTFSGVCSPITRILSSVKSSNVNLFLDISIRKSSSYARFTSSLFLYFMHL